MMLYITVISTRSPIVFMSINPVFFAVRTMGIFEYGCFSDMGGNIIDFIDFSESNLEEQQEVIDGLSVKKNGSGNRAVII